MGIEGNDVLNTHALQLLQSNRAVQAFPGNTPVLPAAVQTGHDNRHTVGSACHCLNQPLQVRKVVIRRHMVFLTEQIIGQAVVAGVYDEENIVSPDRLLDEALCVAALKAGAVTVNDKRVLLNASFPCPRAQVTINQVSQFLSTRTSNQSKMRDLRIRIEKI